MTEDNQQPRSKHNLIEELRAIREAIQRAPESQHSAVDIPLLDEVIATTGDDELANIPVLADSVVSPNIENHQLALMSWELVNKELYQLTAKMDNPMSLLTTELLNAMSSQLSSNWEAIFCSQDHKQLQQWKTLLLQKSPNAED